MASPSWAREGTRSSARDAKCAFSPDQSGRPLPLHSLLHRLREEQLPRCCLHVANPKNWWEAWTGSEDLQRRVRRSWPRIFERISEAPQGRRWTNAWTNREHRRHPHRHRLARTGTGTLDLFRRYVLETSPSPPSFPVHFRFEASLRSELWLAADGGYCGLGLAGGCDMKTLRHGWQALYQNRQPSWWHVAQLRRWWQLGSRSRTCSPAGHPRRGRGAPPLGVRVQQHP